MTAIKKINRITFSITTICFQLNSLISTVTDVLLKAMENEFLNRGIHIIKQAQDAEVENINKAILLYTQGIEILIQSLKYMTSETQKKFILERINQYLEHCEKLKIPETIQNSKPESNHFKTSNKSQIKWSDIIGMHSTKALLKQCLSFPRKFPTAMNNRKPPKAILTFGPPGSGKTMLAQALANENDANFYSVKSSDLISKFMGESEQNLKSLFETAKENKPSIIFIDEIDSICAKRSMEENEASRRVKTEFLQQMNDIPDDVFIIACTNLPEILDDAVLRRFEKRIYITLPDTQCKQELLWHLIEKIPHTVQKPFSDLIATRLINFSNADISIFVNTASRIELTKAQSSKHFVFDDLTQKYTACSGNNVNAKKISIDDLPQDSLNIPPLNEKHLEQAIKTCKSSIDQTSLQTYENWTHKYAQNENV